jgi:hypothetical protein
MSKGMWLVVLVLVALQAGALITISIMLGRIGAAAIGGSHE